MLIGLMNQTVSVVLLLLCICFVGCSKTETAAVRSPPSTETTVGTAVLKLEKDIARVNDLVFGNRREDCEVLEDIYQRIRKLPDAGERRRLLGKYLDEILSFDFGRIGNVLTCDSKERSEIARQLSLRYSRIGSLVDKISNGLMASQASVKDFFEPHFRYYEMIYKESQEKDRNSPYFQAMRRQIEYTYRLYKHSGGFKSEDFKWVEDEFQKIAGRPIQANLGEPVGPVKETLKDYK